MKQYERLIAVFILLMVIGASFYGHKIYRSMHSAAIERRAIEANLLHSEERFRVLYDNAPDLYISVSPDDGRIILCNETLLGVTGFTRDEIIGKHIFEMYHEESLPKAKAMFQKFVDIGRIRDEELILKLKDGSKLDVSLNVDMFRDESGKILYSLSSWRDITERKAAQKVLLSHQTTLEQTVKDRTRELVVAKEQAESANREKSRFLANMSHELRTPMHAILSFTQLSLKRVEDPKVRRFLENINTSGTRLTALLNNLLDLAKLEAGKMVPVFAKHDLTVLTRQCISEVHSLSTDKELTIEINTDEPVEGIFDQPLMAQVIVNLLSNAIKFSPANSKIKIDIERSRQWLDKREQTTLKLAVTDQGIGIPKDDLKTVFDKFVQSSKTQTNAGGTGLGLPIVSEIVNIHKGEIWAISPVKEPDMQSDNKEYVGTAFHLMIPAEQRADAESSALNPLVSMTT